jgi:uncharacterized RDD family membrane protein YckC
MRSKDNLRVASIPSRLLASLIDVVLMLAAGVLVIGGYAGIATEDPSACARRRYASARSERGRRSSDD